MTRECVVRGRLDNGTSPIRVSAHGAVRDAQSAVGRRRVDRSSQPNVSTFLKPVYRLKSIYFFPSSSSSASSSHIYTTMYIYI